MSKSYEFLSHPNWNLKNEVNPAIQFNSRQFFSSDSREQFWRHPFDLQMISRLLGIVYDAPNEATVVKCRSTHKHNVLFHIAGNNFAN